MKSIEDLERAIEKAKLKGAAEGWWPPALDDKSLGVVLQDPTVRARIESDLSHATWEKLKASVLYLRNTGMHQRYTEVSLPDAAASIGTVLGIVNLWVV
jgi:hypothetical protein